MFCKGLMVGVAQLVEHQVVALGVEGSSPFTHPIFIIPLQNTQSILQRYCFAPVAQMDRAPDFESVGRRFESCRAYQKNDKFHPLQNVQFLCIKVFLFLYDRSLIPASRDVNM